MRSLRISIFLGSFNKHYFYESNKLFKPIWPQQTFLQTPKHKNIMARIQMWKTNKKNEHALRESSQLFGIPMVIFLLYFSEILYCLFATKCLRWRCWRLLREIGIQTNRKMQGFMNKKTFILRVV